MTGPQVQVGDKARLEQIAQKGIDLAEEGVGLIEQLIASRDWAGLAQACDSLKLIALAQAAMSRLTGGDQR